MPTLVDHLFLTFPEGLVECFKEMNERQIRRRVMVFVNGEFLAVPDRQYKLVDDAIHFTRVITENDVVSIIVLGMDERWYYTRRMGWCRT